MKNRGIERLDNFDRCIVYMRLRREYKCCLSQSGTGIMLIRKNCLHVISRDRLQLVTLAVLAGISLCTSKFKPKADYRPKQPLSRQFLISMSNAAPRNRYEAFVRLDLSRFQFQISKYGANNDNSILRISPCIQCSVNLLTGKISRDMEHQKKRRSWLETSVFVCTYV